MGVVAKQVGCNASGLDRIANHECGYTSGIACNGSMGAGCNEKTATTDMAFERFGIRVAEHDDSLAVFKLFVENLKGNSVVIAFPNHMGDEHERIGRGSQDIPDEMTIIVYRDARL